MQANMPIFKKLKLPYDVVVDVDLYNHVHISFNSWNMDGNIDTN